MANFRLFKQNFDGKWAVLWTLDGVEYVIIDPLTLRVCKGTLEDAKKCFADPHIESGNAPAAEQDLTGFVKPAKKRSK